MSFRLGRKGLPHKEQQASYLTPEVEAEGTWLSAGSAFIVKLCLQKTRAGWGEGIPKA